MAQEKRESAAETQNFTAAAAADPPGSGQYDPAELVSSRRHTKLTSGCVVLSGRKLRRLHICVWVRFSAGDNGSKCPLVEPERRENAAERLPGCRWMVPAAAAAAGPAPALSSG
ncbi:unnamed protein product [Pleuronectes platessa]|uniref:Uncharacterized protein n=1 Tax=Pleuronectes platessa TaxID=8262 RepID=A0A9N7YGN0_PLEPL|nr:unnamed protein product [Pleuronectes platessa]